MKQAGSSSKKWPVADGNQSLRWRCPTSLSEELVLNTLRYEYAAIKKRGKGKELDKEGH